MHQPFTFYMFSYIPASENTSQVYVCTMYAGAHIQHTPTHTNTVHPFESWCRRCFEVYSCVCHIFFFILTRSMETTSRRKKAGEEDDLDNQKYSRINMIVGFRYILRSDNRRWRATIFSNINVMWWIKWRIFLHIKWMCSLQEKYYVRFSGKCKYACIEEMMY